MGYLLRFVFLFFIMINVFARSSSKEITSMSGNNIENLNDIPIKGPIFISTVYPCTELKSNQIDTLEYIDQAYDLRGKEIIQAFGSESYFPAPLSYPYKFSQAGIEIMVKDLQGIDSVEYNSVERLSFPNIHKNDQHLFGNHLGKILVEEEYVYFRLKGWNNVHFMKFPTFVVMNFDFTDPKALSFQDYKKYKAYWRERTEEFQTNENLRQILGVSRQKYDWSPTPQLVFISLDTYQDEKFMNRYFTWGSDESINKERQHAFLRELSLLEHPKDLSSSTAILRHFMALNSPLISHEYYFTNTWRFYYLQYPLFYSKGYLDLSSVGTRRQETQGFPAFRL